MFKWLYLLLFCTLACTKPVPVTPINEPVTTIEIEEVTETKINWQNTDENLIQRGKTENKLLFLFFYTSDCIECDQMFEIFQDEEVIFGINATFIAAKFDVKDNPQAYSLLVSPAFNDNTIIVPAITIIIPTGVAIAHKGIVTKEKIINIIDIVNEHQYGLPKSVSISKGISP
jgi:hypothetical protein